MDIKLKTKEDWWNEFARIKDDIKEWGPSDRPIKSYNLHLISNTKLREFYEANKELTFWTIVDNLEKEQNPILWLVLETIWIDAPDQEYIHEWPSWGHFCDLCSEGGWILYGDEE